MGISRQFGWSVWGRFFRIGSQPGFGQPLSRRPTQAMGLILQRHFHEKPAPQTLPGATSAHQVVSTILPSSNQQRHASRLIAPVAPNISPRRPSAKPLRDSYPARFLPQWPRPASMTLQTGGTRCAVLVAPKPQSLAHKYCQRCFAASAARWL